MNNKQLEAKKVKVLLTYPVIRWGQKKVEMTEEEYEKLMNAHYSDQVDFIVENIKDNEAGNLNLKMIEDSLDGGGGSINLVAS